MSPIVLKRWRKGMLALAAGMMLTLAVGGARAEEQATTATRTTELPGIGQDVQTLKAGAQAPEFKGVTMDGEEVSLKHYQGKFVLLEFWAVWCGFCVAETPSMKALHDEFGKDPRFVMLGMNLDKNLGLLEKYLEKNGMKWPQCLLGDWAKEDKITKAYGIREIPTMFLIDPKGKILAVSDTGKEIREAVAKALGKKETKKQDAGSGQDAKPKSVGTQGTLDPNDPNISTQERLARQKAIIKEQVRQREIETGQRPGTSQILPMNQDPNDPTASFEERMRRQKALIFKRLQERQEKLAQEAGTPINVAGEGK